MVLVIFNNNLDDTRNVRLMTWNIHGGEGIDGAYNLEDIVEIIDAINPDIVGLNEVVTEINVSKMADELNMYYYFAEAGDTNEGNAVLSKFPIKKAKHYDLPLIETTRARVLIEVTLRVNGRDWVIYVTHLARFSNYADQNYQIEYILKKIDNNQQKRVIFMGDLNFQPGSFPYFTLITGNSVQLRDTYSSMNDDEGGTMRSNAPVIRIDYIFATYDLKPLNSKTICRQSSDHCAVITDF